MRNNTSWVVVVAAALAALAAFTWKSQDDLIPVSTSEARLVSAMPQGDVEVYDTFEISFEIHDIPGNPFGFFLPVRFSQGDHSYSVEAFHDGETTWRARFMTATEGEWTFDATLNGDSKRGSFRSWPNTVPLRHGHVRVDRNNPRYLAHDDGTPHYWFGAHWMRPDYYGPPAKGGSDSALHLSDEQIVRQLDLLKGFGHNGILLKMALFPLEDDRVSWDLEWIRRAEWVVRRAGERGIYCHINMFDTWSRKRGAPFVRETDGRKQVFNVWADGDAAAKENYLRTLVARFSGFYNVYWELGNEMEHRPNDGAAFVLRANRHYVPWIRRYDPYGLPIGLSEGIWEMTDVEIGLLHQANEFPRPEFDRPVIMNELVRGLDPAVEGRLWMDSVIRDPKARLSYRRTFWRAFTHGGCGSSQATWLDIATPPNDAVLAVMGDQMRLRRMLGSLPVSINEMDPDSDTVIAGPAEGSLRSKKGDAYIGYFLGKTGPGRTSLGLPAGEYLASWHDPAVDASPLVLPLSTDGSPVVLDHPAFDEDIVLRIVRSDKITTPSAPEGQIDVPAAQSL